MNTDRIDIIKQAIYKSCQKQISFSQINDVVSGYISDKSFFPVTKQEFLTAIREFAEYNHHLILGGRNSENPALVLYENYKKN